MRLHARLARLERARPVQRADALTLGLAPDLEGEAEALTRQAVAMALDGDTTALRLCLERIAPPRKDTPVAFHLPPMETAADAAKTAAGVLEAVSTGDLTPVEGAQVMSLVETYRRTLETSEFEARLTALEGNTA